MYNSCSFVSASFICCCVSFCNSGSTCDSIAGKHTDGRCCVTQSTTKCAVAQCLQPATFLLSQRVKQRSTKGFDAAPLQTPASRCTCSTCYRQFVLSQPPMLTTHNPQQPRGTSSLTWPSQ
jgi:hypothetical protein